MTSGALQSENHSFSGPGGHHFNCIDTKLVVESREEISAFLRRYLQQLTIVIMYDYRRVCNKSIFPSSKLPVFGCSNRSHKPGNP